MAVLTSTLTVNAAFLAEIKEDNRRLRSLLAVAADDATRETGRMLNHRERVEVYHAIRDQLGLHFTLEDAYGYFRDALEENPRLCSEATRLHAQHDILFEELCLICDVAECILYSESGAETPQNLVRRFIEFYNRLAAHEHAENELILSAFDDDIGVGD